MKKISLVISCCLLMIGLQAQRDGIVNLNEQAKVTSLMDRWIAANRTNTTVDGYRIQLLATTDRTKMEQEFAKFQRFYPTIAVNWTNERPYYKIVAGAFPDKMSASRLLNRIQRDYRDAYLTRAKFQISELL